MEAINSQGSQNARSLKEASLDPLFIISPEGKITDINKACTDITEVTRKNLIGNILGVAVAARDITDRKRIEKELKDAR